MWIRAGFLVVVMAGCVRAEGLVVAPATSPGVPFTIGPTTTVVTGPVGKDGLPDYAAALNERYGKGVTAENNAAVEWLHLMGDDILAGDERDAELRAMGARLAPTGTAVWSDENDPVQLATTAKQLWRAADFPEVDAFVKQRGPLLDRLVDLSGKTHWFWPAVITADGLYLYTGPRYAGAADLLRALASRATERAAGKDFAGFEGDTLGLLRLSQLCGHGATMLERVIADVAQSLAVEDLSAAAEAQVFTRGQWKQLAAAATDIAPVDNIEPLDVLLRYEDLRAQQLTAIGAHDSFLKDPDAAEDPAFVAMLVNRGHLDWNLILERDNADWDECIRIERMPAGPAREGAVKAMDQRFAKGLRAAVDDENHLDRHPGESWQAYSERVQAWSISVSPVGLANDTLAKRQDEATATWEKLHALLVAQSQSR
ncbi:MAG TPA: hypothetical protein VH253_20220 [Phycisphaerae bacterium]|nr:hypothetical protein [Phycisphaerae bacterium]